VGVCATVQAQQTVHGSVPGYIKQLGLRPIGRLDSTKVLTLGIGLSLRNRPALTSLLQQLYTPGSPRFHEWLTPSEFTAQFGPSQADYQGVINYLEANGFTVKKTYPNRMLIDASATVGHIEKAFHLRMTVYNRRIGKGTFFAPDSEPTIALSVPIVHISGLSNDVIAVTHMRAKPLTNVTPTPNTNGSGPGNGYDSKDFRAAYAPGVSLTGSGQTVGLLELDGFYSSGVTTYESKTGLANPPAVSTVLIDGFNGNPMGNEGKVTLDIEMAMAMAPALSKIVSYEAPDTGNYEKYFEDILNEMVQDSYIKQFSCSWGLHDQYWHDFSDQTADNSFLEMAADGQSFFQASGDEDAIINSTWISGVDTVYSYFGFPSDDPNVTSVGGTELTTTGPGGSYVSKSVWNPDTYYYPHHAYSGSSGGISNLYSIPNWQQGANSSNNQVSTTYRNVPDVALVADNIYEYVDQTDQTTSGTSAAAPLWAGFTAMVNQREVADGGSPIGFINPAIYRIGQGSAYSSDLHDIQAGTVNTNKWPGSGSDFTSTTGYDLCTGWGTPSGQALINDLAYLDLTFSSNYTVSSGTTFRLYPGIHVTFSNGASLIVSGTLIAIGTPTNPITFTSSSGTWGGIQFNNSTGWSTIQYATIQNGTYGVCENNSDVYVANCTIQNNSTGVYCYASSDSLFNNQILSNSSYGIYASNVTTAAYYRGNAFNNNGQTMFCNNAVPSYAFNRGTDLSSGIMVNSSNEVNIWTHQPEGYDLGGYNVINCGGEPNVGAENYSVVYMGYDVHGGYNTLCESNLPMVTATNHSTVLADNNYWGGGLAPVYADGTSTILARNPLSSDPNNAGCSKYQAPVSSSANVSIPDSSQSDKQLWNAVSTGLGGDPSRAMSMLETIINGNYDDKNSPLALLYYDSFPDDFARTGSSIDSSQYNSLISTLKAVPSRPAGDSLKPFAIRLLAREAALSKDFAGANRYNTDLVNNYPNSVNQLCALYDPMEYDLVATNDTAKAQIYLSEMVANYPNESLTATAQKLMNQKNAVSKSQKQNQPLTVEKQQPDKFLLSPAYPNSFNPTTMIKYQLPKDSHVTLKVYDILGREVMTLVNGMETAGMHEVTFDGSKFASGVYFYRLTTPRHIPAL